MNLGIPTPLNRGERIGCIAVNTPNKFHCPAAGRSTTIEITQVRRRLVVHALMMRCASQPLLCRTLGAGIRGLGWRYGPCPKRGNAGHHVLSVTIAWAGSSLWSPQCEFLFNLNLPQNALACLLVASTNILYNNPNDRQ